MKTTQKNEKKNPWKHRGPLRNKGQAERIWENNVRLWPLFAEINVKGKSSGHSHHGGVDKWDIIKGTKGASADKKAQRFK